MKRKKEIALRYYEAFKNSEVEFQAASKNVTHSYWMCSILVKNANDRDTLREFLAERGIETRPLFYPIHTMPMYATKYQKHPIAEDLGWRGINLPSFPLLSDLQIEFIIDSVKSYFK